MAVVVIVAVVVVVVMVVIVVVVSVVVVVMVVWFVFLNNRLTHSEQYTNTISPRTTTSPVVLEYPQQTPPRWPSG